MTDSQREEKTVRKVWKGGGGSGGDSSGDGDGGVDVAGERKGGGKMHDRR